MLETTWTEQQVRKMLEVDDFKYQDIELPYGLSTGGYDRSETARAIFPDDMTGKSVLDLGCKFGYFCFEALKRGADRVVGVDVDPESVRKARLLADCLGWKTRFEQFDIEEKSLDESFDYVLCLNLLHHMKNPLSLLENLIDVTRERLILEVASLGSHDRRKMKISPVANYFLKRSPVIFVSRNGTWGKRAVQKFFITQKAVDNLLRFHRGMFAKLDTLPTPHKDRYITVAHKRRINRLVVVTGPTSAGKKTLCNRQIANDLPDLNARVGIEDGAEWGPRVHANRIWQPLEPAMDKMILHYDFLRPHLRSAKVHKRDEAMDVIGTARDVTFVTIWTPPPRLRAQIRSGEIDPKTKFGFFFGRNRHKRIAEEYEDDARIIEHYRNWFRYAATHRRAKHVVVCLDEPVTMYGVDEWERDVASHYDPE